MPLDKEYQNWITAAHALIITKQGLEQFVQQSIAKWYQGILGLPHLNASQTGSCTCSPSDKCKLCSKCKVWRTELKNHHSVTENPWLSWNNSCCSDWGSPSKEWEVAKVFMSTLGKRKGNIKDAASTDLTGILSILQWSNCEMSLSKSLVEEVTNIRNDWAHSPYLKFTDDELKKTFDSVENLLRDRLFTNVQKVQESLKHLENLRRNGLTIIDDAEKTAIAELKKEIEIMLDDAKAARDEAVRASDETVRSRDEVLKITKCASQLVESVRVRIESFNDFLDKSSDELAEFRLDNLEKKMETLVQDVKVLRQDVETLKQKGVYENKQNNGARARPFSNIPIIPKSDIKFSGREKEREDLKVFFNTKNDQTGIVKVKAICGLGGSGKSNLVKTITNDLTATSFPGGMYWLNGESEETFQTNAREIAALLNMEQNSGSDFIELITLHLLRERLQWILIIDNVDAESISMSKLVNSLISRRGPAQGTILITTRRNKKEAATKFKISETNCIELGCLSSDEASTFLCDRTLKYDTELAKEIAKEVGFLPLALQQVAVCINDTELSFLMFLQKYQKEKLPLLDQHKLNDIDCKDARRTSVLTTWEMDITLIEERSSNAIKMLKMSAVLYPDDIPSAIIIPKEHQIKILSVMTQNSLVKQDKSKGTYSINKMVQEFVKGRLEEEEMKDVITSCMQLLNEYRIENGEDKFHALTIHVLELMKNIRVLINKKKIIERRVMLQKEFVSLFQNILKNVPDISKENWPEQLNDVQSDLVVTRLEIIQQIDQLTPVDKFYLADCLIDASSIYEYRASPDDLEIGRELLDEAKLICKEMKDKAAKLESKFLNLKERDN